RVIKARKLRKEREEGFRQPSTHFSREGSARAPGRAYVTTKRNGKSSCSYCSKSGHHISECRKRLAAGGGKQRHKQAHASDASKSNSHAAAGGGRGPKNGAACFICRKQG
ncbi:unnamed protein product, partial [Phaeothamnion confervicola]